MSNTKERRRVEAPAARKPWLEKALPTPVVEKLSDLFTVHDRFRMALDIERFEELMFLYGAQECSSITSEDFNAMYFLRQIRLALAMQVEEADEPSMN